jgi:hypothetical protein
MSHNTYVVKVGNDYVERHGMVVADASDPLAVADVINTTPAGDAYGLVVRMIGTVSVTGGGGGAVYGPSSIGNVLTNPPNAVGGVDAGGLLRAVRTDAAGYQLTMITNGTQFMPTMDAAARKGFQQITDGTNLMPTMDAAARRGYFTHTDGTNSMPTGDAVARGIYHRITDGVTQVAVKAASTAAVAADPALVVAMNPINNTAALAWFTKLTDGTTTAKVQPASTAAVTADPGVTVSLSPNLAATPYALSAAATTNAVAVKASAGTLFSIICSNTAATTNYLKFYNKASAPTVGTDVPVLTIAVATNQTVALELGTLGYRFATGIAIATTLNAVDSDTTVLAAANTMKIALSYN